MLLVSSRSFGASSQFGINMIAAIPQSLTVDQQAQTIEIIFYVVATVLLSSQY
jgi:hypothetical protein